MLSYRLIAIEGYAVLFCSFVESETLGWYDVVDDDGTLDGFCSEFACNRTDEVGIVEGVLFVHLGVAECQRMHVIG